MELILCNNQEVSLGDIFPTKIRELSNIGQCMAWVRSFQDFIIDINQNFRQENQQLLIHQELQDIPISVNIESHNVRFILP